MLTLSKSHLHAQKHLAIEFDIQTVPCAQEIYDYLQPTSPLLVLLLLGQPQLYLYGKEWLYIYQLPGVQRLSIPANIITFETPRSPPVLFQTGVPAYSKKNRNVADVRIFEGEVGIPCRYGCIPAQYAGLRVLWAIPYVVGALWAYQ